MENDETVKKLSNAEEAMIDILTQFYLEALQFKFNSEGQPELTDASGEILVDCINFRSLSEKIKQFEYPTNRIEREQEGLGTIYYVLTALHLKAQQKVLYSGIYTYPGDQSYEGQKVWQRFERNGLAVKHTAPACYELVLPDEIYLTSLQKEAQNRAAVILSQDSVENEIKAIQARLRRPAAGEILGRPE